MEEVTCSPRTMQRIIKDPTLLDQYLKNITQNGVSAEPEASTSRTENPQDLFSSLIEEEYADDDTVNSICGGKVWTDPPTKLLLSLISEMRQMVGKTIKLKNKRKMWSKICEIMKENGYNFSESQIENKYRGLERNFKKTNAHNQKTGRNRQTCPYEKELTELLGNNNAVFSVYLLGSKTGLIIEKEIAVPISTASTSTAPGPNVVDCQESSCSGGSVHSRGKKTNADKVLEEIKRMSDSRNKFQEDVLKQLEMGRKEKREINEKKNGILENMLKKL